MGGLPGAPWAYSDLRILAPDLGGDEPAPDLIAGYYRQSGTDLQFRLDLLDLPLEPDADLYLALDTLPGGVKELPVDSTTGRDWDWLIRAPARGGLELYQASQDSGSQSWSARTDAIPRLARDPWNDTIVISLNAQDLDVPSGFYIQAFLSAPGERALLDSLPAFHTQAQPPGRARALLAFWNAFPAYTPAQALRRWDGAHTGPFGGRHGLHVLLQAARRSGIPLTLLDLKTPASLSALDAIGGLNLVKALVADGQLELPDVLPGWPGMEAQAAAVVAADPVQAVAASRQAGLDFDLPGGRLLYAPRLSSRLPPGYRSVFMPLDPPVAQRWQQQTLLPIPVLDPNDPQASSSGLTLPVRRALLQKAIKGDLEPLLLGGDFSQSAWGAAPAAEPSLRYLASHPWIQMLNGDDLVGWRGREEWKDGRLGQDSLLGTFPLINEGLVKSDMRNPLAASALQTYLALQAPLPPQAPNLLGMRAGYLDLPGGLLAGSRWAEAPASISDCSRDPDLDGRAECVLASPQIFALLEPEGGRLVFLFARGSAGVHQVVAPGAQFIAGLSDSSEWQPGAGAASDPGALAGAFGGPLPWQRYSTTSAPDRITFTSPDGQVTKEYTLIGSGLEVKIHSPGPVSFQIPLALDPWLRFAPDWSQRYRAGQTQDRITWTLLEGPQVEIQSTGSLSLSAFNDWKAEPPLHEDPNFDYPAGQYLPYPLAVVGVESGSDLLIKILVSFPGP